ncbi:unnamed protein product [Cylicostephanus goldi]|uniref:Laminin EGF-like domain-containing protein n=1 Tax=Cylicostephanus goldi TaxID=71465 RepID=A0A3P7N6Q3_CYLGO|nr:unnamed protein product [Cylicostephanus goldi]
MDGHGDIENGCPACECDIVGSIGDQCDAISGQCTCKQGVFGKRCDQCRPSYFNFTDAGCQFCHCNIYGSIEDGKCNNVTGKCECRDNVDGTMCEKCADGFFNITSGVGCQACKCDPMGSDGEACDLHSGQCVCKPGVTGLKCDQCLPNHYGLSEEGCKGRAALRHCVALLLPYATVIMRGAITVALPHCDVTNSINSFHTKKFNFLLAQYRTLPGKPVTVWY